MKEKLLFATNNKHKLLEIRDAFSRALPGLNTKYEIIGLEDAGLSGEIPETGDTLHDNALEKAQYINQRCGCNCFADDTGLEIDALEGRPGVYSARYAGENCTFDDNINKIVEELQGINNRKARFRTVIACILDGGEYFFEGDVKGEILEQRRGIDGFGYDPVFQPIGYSQTFAEMDLTLKNEISHRARAFQQFLDFLKERLS